MKHALKGGWGRGGGCLASSKYLNGLMLVYLRATRTIGNCLVEVQAASEAPSNAMRPRK